MSSTDACRELGIARSTLTQWLDKGWIVPADRTGAGAYIFTTGEVRRAKAAYALKSAEAQASADAEAIA